MNLDELKDRLAELDKALIQTTNQILMLQGHKNEVEHQIAILSEKMAKEEADKLANSESPIVE